MESCQETWLQCSVVEAEEAEDSVAEEVAEAKIAELGEPEVGVSRPRVRRHLLQTVAGYTKPKPEMHGTALPHSLVRGRIR